MRKIIFLLVAIFFLSSVQGVIGVKQAAGGLLVTLTFDKSSYLPASKAILTVNLTNPSPPYGYAPCVKDVSLFVDWNDVDYGNPGFYGGNGYNTFNPGSIAIWNYILATPSSPGYHDVVFHLSLSVDTNCTIFTPVSVNDTLLILDPAQSTANVTLINTGLKIQTALGANFSKPWAKASLSKAQSEYGLAQSLYNAGLYSNALEHLERSSNYVDDAYAFEASSSSVAVAIEPVSIVLATLLVISIVGIAWSRTLRNRETLPTVGLN